MQITIQRLSITNFGSFIKQSTIDFDSGSPGLYFLKGKNKLEPRLGANGAGKSTVFNALSWVLYGKTPNGLRNPDLKPWGKRGMTHVMLTLLQDETEHTVERSISPNKILLDGEEVAQESIDTLIGISFDVFQQTVLLGQGRPLFHDLPNREKLDLLSDVLGLDRWEQYSGAASQQVQKLQLAVQADTLKLEGYRNQLDNVHSSIEVLKSLTTKWSQSRDEELVAVRRGLKERRMELQEADLSILAYTMQLESLNATLKEIRIQSKEVGIAQTILSGDAARAEAKISQIKRQITSVGESLKTTKRNKTCPTCGQPVSKADQNKHVEEAQSRLDTLAAELAEIDLQAIRQAMSKISNDVDAISRAEGVAAKNHAHVLQKLTDFKSEAAVARNAIAALTKDEERYATQTSPYKDQMAPLREKQKRLRAERSITKVDLEKNTEALDRTKYWVKGFKDVRLYVLEEVLEELEFVTNDMLESVGLVGWRMSYDIERETKTGTVQRGLITLIESPDHKDPVKWESWSGGESQRLRLAGALALSQVLLGRAGVTINIEVLDEPTRHLSNEGVQDLCEFLSARATSLERNVWLIDHMAFESGIFENVVTVVKSKNGSRLI